MRPAWDKGGAQDCDPVGSQDDGANYVSQERNREPFQDIHDFMIAEVYRGHGSADPKENDEIMRVDGGDHLGDIRHGREVRADGSVFAKSRALERRTTNDFGYLSRNVPANPFPVTSPIRAHIICTAAINGQVMSEVHKRAMPSWAPAME